ncbi:uncharacterized protein LOC125842948 [Solanum stenotomum]|uniref:uncharacterized protein LOC125842948 n=1 Tax=Solanum stenotomum TaxID=172797 RepID=UPI0020D12C43|nr:uncharacterized protein LOC125842948 [Solanum stenotomum]
MYYGGSFLSDPELKYANGISDLEKIRIDIDELHIMFFHKLARELGVEQVETFGCKINKRDGFYMLKSDVDVLRFINNLKGGDFVDVYVVHQISTPLIVEDPTEVQIAQLLTPKKGKPPPPTVINVRADVSSPQPFDKNDTNIKEDQQPRVDKGKNKEAAAPEVSLEDLDEDEGQGQGNDFSSYHLHTSDESDVDVDAKQSNSESLYDVDENIDDLSIDVGFEDIYKNKREIYEGKLGGDDLYFDSSDPGSDISEDEGDPVDSDEVVDPPARNSSTKFREALQTYSIQKGVNIKLKPNKKERIRAKCNKKGCPWHILGSIEGNTGNFIVKTYFSVHKCFKRTRNKLCTPNWICKTYKDRIMSEPSIKLHQIQGLVQKDYGLYVSKTSCRRAKMKVMNEHMGDFIEEFARLYDYAEELKSTNSETTVVVRTSKNTIPGKEVFQGIYICLGTLKSGWMEGCTRIIGFDGAFLKGVCRGELLSCISKDGNNQMYPVAWAVVNKESKDTWSWFIKCIKHDLELTQTEGEGLTVMFDMQKGLNLALVDLLPNAEIRWCARHIWANWKKVWSGEERRKKFWQVAKAPFEVHLQLKLDEMSLLGEGIVKALLKYIKNAWCRVLFKDHSKCDIVENNMCETFNSWILTARFKSIITMLEEITVKVMERMTQMREFSEKWITDVSPMAMQILTDNAEHAAIYEVKFNGDNGYEIQHPPYKHVVNLKKKVCSCRS